jgi:hypothetical protein
VLVSHASSAAANHGQGILPRLHRFWRTMIHVCSPTRTLSTDASASLSWAAATVALRMNAETEPPARTEAAFTLRACSGVYREGRTSECWYLWGIVLTMFDFHHDGSTDSIRYPLYVFRTIGMIVGPFRAGFIHQ